MTSLVFILMTLFSLVHGLPISVLMGQNSCLVFTLTQATHASFMTVQSTGMAAYRLLIMKFQNLVIKIHPYRLTKFILAIEAVLIGKEKIFKQHVLLDQVQNLILNFGKTLSISRVI